MFRLVTILMELRAKELKTHSNKSIYCCEFYFKAYIKKFRMCLVIFSH